MNIYDEAKVITHEEARNRIVLSLDELINLLKHKRLSYKLQEKWKNELFHYIAQQEKNEERAKKVEELNIEQEEYIQALLFDRPYTQEKCVKKIAKIKKELEEMK